MTPEQKQQFDQAIKTIQSLQDQVAILKNELKKFTTNLEVFDDKIIYRKKVYFKAAGYNASNTKIIN